jgi:hypothetical protein
MKELIRFSLRYQHVISLPHFLTCHDAFLQVNALYSTTRHSAHNVKQHKVVEEQLHSARAFGLFGLLGPVSSVFVNFGHLRMLPVLASVFSVFLYSVFALFSPVFGHDRIDQIEKNGSRVYTE